MAYDGETVDSSSCRCLRCKTAFAEIEQHPGGAIVLLPDRRGIILGRATGVCGGCLDAIFERLLSRRPIGRARRGRTCLGFRR